MIIPTVCPGAITHLWEEKNNQCVDDDFDDDFDNNNESRKK